MRREVEMPEVSYGILDKIEGISDIDIEPDGLRSKIMKILYGVLTGEIRLDKDAKEALRILGSKVVPDAPKEINLRSQARVEVVVRSFLESNAKSFDVIEETARRWGAEEDEITRMLEAGGG